ncbi:type II CRISPR RNA-guided endonuclease Cas9 [Amniculibacterium sp. G2-70]|uniref:type II CRISPR RNA-guided endonuclease Cas9 n=1 Tax=Amniculibacterium sp. G2-70 TaxID=2767188 RepID=UPI0016548D5A|nr:type II CRISPR RNA-guided endonuclease Cas9 [Amniculibacterium sp. G2-70]
MAKKILGLDLGTNSIGWAYVTEGETQNESEIKQIGVRVNPLTVDEQTNFEKGKSITTNADRTLKRGARRNLDRYQLRRENLLEVLTKANIINATAKLCEDGKQTTFQTWELRAKAASERIELNEFARVLLAINKKRGYKSSRKAKNSEEGQAIDGMGIVKRLYEENLTPGQLVYQNYENGLKAIPDFYRSDLQSEFDKVWNFQKQFYPEILTDEFYKDLQGKGQKATSALFWTKYQFNTADIKDYDDNFKNKFATKFDSRTLKKIQAYKWRSDAVSKQLEKEQMAYVLTEINNNLNNSSGYLGAISDRSKELFFNKETVGQNQYNQLLRNRHTALKNQVFYRQDYLDEFEKIWTTQAKYHAQLTDKLKEEIRDIVIFYQRKLKSQKGLISFCEFESKEIEKDGKKKTVGMRVAPKSSPLFQEFKIWQILHNVLVKKAGSKKRSVKKENQPSLFEEEKEIFELDLAAKNQVFEELNIKGNLKANQIIDILGYKPKDWEMNYSQLEGNRTNQALYNAYLKILEIEGYNEDLLKLSDKDDINIEELKTPASEIKSMVKAIFEVLEINTEILEFDAELEEKDFENQAAYQLWHLLYSTEDDTKKYNEEDILLYGNDNIGLKKQLCAKFGFKPDHAKILVNVVFQDDYGSLSTKAMRKIYPYIKENKYSEACELAGYRHSKHSLTKEELENRTLKPQLDLLKKNSLRNPVVEKILNQMVNVVNTLIDKENNLLKSEGKEPNFQFDEIRIELSRELKKNAAERAEMTTNISAAKIAHEKIVKLLQTEFGVANPTRNDIVRYKLYEELKNNGYKDLYTDTYIPREILFSKQVDIEHIIPQSRLFDDSFSNKTIVYRKDNLEKGNQTAIEYIETKFGETGLISFQERIEDLHKLWNKNNPENGISKAKYQKLLKRSSEIGEGFIERDLRDSQYIAKKAKEMLFGITRSVVSTSGQITDRLREDWDLVNIMKELNLPKYRALGLTEMEERKYGQKVEVIKDWTKRNDHRHHAMDALTIAFTKRSFIQYLNNLNARRNEKSDDTISNSKGRTSMDTSNLKLSTRDVLGIEEKETIIRTDDQGNKKRVFKEPITNFRQVAKEHLENVIVSHKAKNKVVTKNKNKVRGSNKVQEALTPRGQLHKETVYGKYQYYVQKEEKVGAKFDKETIDKVGNPLYKKLLLQRLEEYGNDSKKAFTGKNTLEKSPIYLNTEKTEVLPEKVKLVWLEEDFSIRKDVTPDLKIDKVIDKAVRTVLEGRLKEFGGDAKKAFSDLDKNPIWLNKEKGISIKRVTISGVSNAEALHYKKDHFGKPILDANGNKIAVDFVQTGNNHHVAVYRDEKGNLQENVVSLYEAVARVNMGLPIIDKTYKQSEGWQFLFTMKQNELFVFPNEKTGFDPAEIDLLDPKNKKLISPNMFRVQKFSKVTYGNSAVREYVFRHHLETTVDDKKELKDVTYKNIKSLGYFEGIIKVRTNHLGDIIGVGEY